MVDEELGIVLSLKQKQELLSGLAQVRSAIKGAGTDTEQAGQKAVQSSTKWQRLQDRVDKFSGATGRARKVSGALFGVLVANSQGALGPISEVQSKLMGVGQALEDTQSKAGKWAIGMGAAMTGVGTVLGTMFSKEQIAGNQLDSAITGAGKNVDDFKGRIADAIKTGEKYGDTQARTETALNRLVLATHNPAEAFKLYNDVLNISAARHRDVESVALTVGRALHGQMRSLQAFGINVVNTTKLQAAATSAAKERKTALEKVTTAQQNLADVEARIKQANAGGASSALKLAQAHVSVETATVALTRAQQKYGAGSGNAILAQQKLAIAQGRANQAAAAGHTQGGLTLSQQIALRKAHDALAKAQESVMSATKKQTKAQTDANKAGSIGDQIHHQVGKYLAGQGAAAVHSFTGHLHALAATLDDRIASAGGHVYKWLVTMGPALMGVGAIMETGVIGKFAKGTKALMLWSDESKIVTGVTKVWTGVQAVFNAVMDANPIMLAVIALVALAAIFVAAYRKSKTFRDFIKTVGRDIKNIFGDVVSWFKRNWEYVLFGILFGPFGLAVTWIVKHWSQVKGFFSGVVEWFKSNWEYVVLPILFGPFGLAVAWVVKHWDRVVSFFGGLPQKIGKAFESVGDFLLAPFKWAFNMIARIWNDTAGKLSFHLPGWLPGIGGKGFSMPQIPYWGGGSDLTTVNPGQLVQGSTFNSGSQTPGFHTGGHLIGDSFVNMKPGEEIVGLPGGTTIMPVNNSDLVDLLGGQHGGDIIVPVQIDLDGKTIAETTFKYVRDKAARS